MPPTVAGKAAPKGARSSGRRAQQMPMCDYGAACTRKGCIYRHPARGSVKAAASEDAEVCKPFLAGACTFGARCRNLHPSEDEADRLRRQYALMDCRFGDECRSAVCLYRHPWDADPQTSGHLDDETEAARLALLSCEPCANVPRAVENLPDFSADCGAVPGAQPSAAEWMPDASAAEWAPDVTAPEWAPGAGGWSAAAAPQPPATGSWAAVAYTPAGASSRSAPSGHAAGQPSRRAVRTVRMPEELWLADVARVDAAAAFRIVDPIARCRAATRHDRTRPFSPSHFAWLGFAEASRATLSLWQVPRGEPASRSAG